MTGQSTSSRREEAPPARPFLAFVLLDPRLNQFLNKCTRQWPVLMEADGPLGRGRSSSILKCPITVTVENKLLKALAARRDAISIQAAVENKGVLSGLAKLG